MTKKSVFQKRPKSMVAVNKKLWAECQAWARRTYDVHPSAYSNSAAVKRYNAKGGKWRKPDMSKKAEKLNFDIKENDLMPPFSLPEAQILVDRMNIDLDSIGTNIDEFLTGINIELEHSSLTGGDPSDTARIALDHLKEDPEYYTKLKTIEASADIAKSAKPLGGLGHWHKKEKWVDISKKDKSGKHPPCGREDADKGATPRCRPASEAAKLSPSEKKKESEKKRKVENTKKRKGKKPHMVKFDYMKKANKQDLSDEEFWDTIADEVEDALDAKASVIAARIVRLAEALDRRGATDQADAVDRAFFISTAGPIDAIRKKIEDMREKYRRRWNPDIQSTPSSAEAPPKKHSAGIVIKNIAEKPVFFTSNAALDAAVRQRHFEIDKITEAIVSKLEQFGELEAVASIKSADFASKYKTARMLATKHGLLTD